MKELAELIRLRYNGKISAPDFEDYFLKMEKIMNSAYRDRYRSFHIRDNESSEVIPLSEYLGIAWARLEDNGDKSMIHVLANNSYKDEKHCVNYVRKCFENILQELIYDMTPGYRTRQKQILRVLAPMAVTVTVNGNKCIRLQGCSVSAPASPDCVQEAAYSVPLPRPRRAAEDAQRDPGIADADMQTYLVKVINKCGGTISQEDLVKIVMNRYAINYVKMISGPSSPFDGDENEEPDQEDFLSWLANVNGDMFLNPEHYSMALEFLESLDDSEKTAYALCRQVGMKQKEAAARMGISDTKVSRLLSDVSLKFLRYMDVDPEKISPELISEAAAVKAIWTELIAKQVP